MQYPLYNETIRQITNLGDLAVFTNETATGKYDSNAQREGSLAKVLRPPGNTEKEINVVADYRWTLSNLKNTEDLAEVPFVRLREFKCVDSSIKRQMQFYTQLGIDTVESAFGLDKNTNLEVLDSYQEIWPKDNPTNFSYKFPYFNKTAFELQTEPWQSLDSVGDATKKITTGIGQLLNNAEIGNSIQKGIDFFRMGTNLALNSQYPTVGVPDRPKIFTAHGERNINISFTLYNTVREEDWKKNRDLLYLLMSQNLYNKRDYTTGVPPVFYDVYIPGQYFCYAAAMTNIKVEHLGNQRLFYGDDGFVVPDAYQVDLTLTELVKPSKNQFESLADGTARNKVRVNPKLNLLEAALVRAAAALPQ